MTPDIDLEDRGLCCQHREGVPCLRSRRFCSFRMWFLSRFIFCSVCGYHFRLISLHGEMPPAAAVTASLLHQTCVVQRRWRPMTGCGGRHQLRCNQASQGIPSALCTRWESLLHLGQVPVTLLGGGMPSHHGQVTIYDDLTSMHRYGPVICDLQPCAHYMTSSPALKQRSCS
jgi:hypothetical protein